MTLSKTTALAVKLTLVAAAALSLSGCLIVVADDDGDFHHGHHRDAPATDEKPAETGSF
ncbi:hypothetical protein ABAC460_11595 [Asticcacaulis sp. AC460]|uniref:hypothetical protein n=1 Tax=Asticcacaulis sp. AC460 TaxID=1282360 RepID=UPI0003C40665|nr:hypothetical protein [Asticcacaulis sp. AC460]ESQ89512.1 hypothetical protein ABAC460_11595 [Asticcacaulis sp. AC460]